VQNVSDNNMKKTILIIILFLSGIFVNAQLTKDDSLKIIADGYDPNRIYVFDSAQHDILLLKISFIRNQYNAIEIGILNNGEKKSVGAWQGRGGFNFGAEICFSKNNHYIAPKISLELYPLILASRINLLYYYDLHGNYSLKLRPEIGFGEISYWYVMYGYNLSLLNKDVLPIRHNLTVGVSICIFSKLYKGYRDQYGDFMSHIILKYPLELKGKRKRRIWRFIWV